MSATTHLQSPMTEGRYRDLIQPGQSRASQSTFANAEQQRTYATSNSPSAMPQTNRLTSTGQEAPAEQWTPSQPESAAKDISHALQKTTTMSEAALSNPQAAATESSLPTPENEAISEVSKSRDQSPAPPNRPAFYGTRRWLSQAVVASFIAGGVAGAVSRTVVSPLERLKILLQVQNPGRTEYKMSIPKALAKIWKEEGFKGMMAGNGTNCIRIVPYSAVQFGSYNLYKPFFEASPDEPLSAPRRLACGALAGITSVTVTYPLDIVRTRLSIQSASFEGLTPTQAEKKLPGMWQTLVHMYKTEGGASALYRGMIPTVAGVAPYVGLNFMIYESVRQYFTPEGRDAPTSIGKLCAGAISGACAQTATYPFDVLRRRFQINTMSGMGYKYKGLFDAVRVIITNEGVAGLYKGIVPNLLKVAPSMASSWLSFEMTRDFIVSLKPIELVDEPIVKSKL